MPLLENGVRSAIRVSGKLGVHRTEIGTQISGASFASRRADLIKPMDNMHYDREKAKRGRRKARIAIVLGVLGLSVTVLYKGWFTK